MKKILISTGGSGGHVVLALNLYHHLKENFDVNIYTDVRGAKYIPRNINKIIFEVKKIPDKNYLLPLKILFLFLAFIKALINLSKNKFDILVSTGGYMSLPLVLAAKLFKKKIFLFEPNSIIGQSNKFLLNFSNKIFCYDKKLKGINRKYLHKIIPIPPILKKCFYTENINNLKNDSLKILIIGGSQASFFFSKNLKQEIIKLASKYNIQVTQQLSDGFNINDYKKDYTNNNIQNNLFFFEENLLCNNPDFDIAISRSGASSLAELSHLNIPFITIPFPHATDNHQFLNAKRYHELNCCWILEEKNFNSGDIYKIINQIMVNKSEYIKKKNNLNRLCKNNTWKIINEKLIKNLDDN